MKIYLKRLSLGYILGHSAFNIQKSLLRQTNELLNFAMVPTYIYIFYYAYNVIRRKWSTLYKRYVIWECSITTINPNYVNLMFSPHKAFRMVCWIYEYECMNFYEPCMRERVRTCFVEHHILLQEQAADNTIKNTPRR